MKIVVDTNILFSALLSPSGIISDLIFNSSGAFDFFSPDTVDFELDKHWQKLIKLSKLTTEEVDELKYSLVKKIEILQLDYISSDSWKKSIQLVEDIDEFDAPFIALNMEIHGTLWTGDKKLIQGLKKKGYSEIIRTTELISLRDELIK